VLNILLHVSAFLNAIIRESDMNMLRWRPMSWKAEKDESCILWRPDYYTGTVQLPSFSASHHIGQSLRILISDSLMMAFRNAETCSSILSTNTLNEWCICWSFINRKKMHGPKCKKSYIVCFIHVWTMQSSVCRKAAVRSSGLPATADRVKYEAVSFEQCTTFRRTVMS
jgi:hypothetical protein